MFSRTAATKGTRTCLWSKKLELKAQRTRYVIYNPQALSSALALLERHNQGLWVINSVDSYVLKSNYYVGCNK